MFVLKIKKLNNGQVMYSLEKAGLTNKKVYLIFLRKMSNVMSVT